MGAFPAEHPAGGIVLPRVPAWGQWAPTWGAALGVRVSLDRAPAACAMAGSASLESHWAAAAMMGGRGPVTPPWPSLTLHEPSLVLLQRFVHKV